MCCFFVCLFVCFLALGVGSLGYCNVEENLPIRPAASSASTITMPRIVIIFSIFKATADYARAVDQFGALWSATFKKKKKKQEV